MSPSTEETLGTPITPEQAHALLNGTETVFVRCGGYTFHRQAGYGAFYYFAYGTYPHCLRTMKPVDLEFIQRTAERCGSPWRQLTRDEITRHPILEPTH